MVWNDELKREIPEGWEVKKAKDICPVVTGKEDANFSTPN
jgi:type I restriction enzyme S subunit